jgi:ferrous iron transport protein B
VSKKTPLVVLVGHPNVGKSQLFNLLTGSQAVVSNYPGTTVELARGKGKIEDSFVEVIDSPGFYSLSALSPEEQVTRLLLLRERPDLVIQVIDACNLGRMLSLTLELLEAGLPLLVALNMMDEAEAAGLKIDSNLLARRLGVSVVPTALVARRGLKQLCREAAAVLRGSSRAQVPRTPLCYPAVLERQLALGESCLKGSYGISRRAVVISLLHSDPVLEREISTREGSSQQLRLLRQALHSVPDPLLQLAAARRRQSQILLKGVLAVPSAEPYSMAERLSRFLVNPWSGGMVLAAVLYFGFYRFVGGFGAGTLVKLLEERLFLQLIAPLLNRWAELYLPWTWLRELLVLDYGILTLGLRYTVTIILPIMATFFLFFSLIEDSGYLPRAAYLINNLMEKIGLNGKAIIPLTLGLGCGTLAVLATRTLESRQERLQAALLLSLAIPCSAQLGLILALLPRMVALLLWLIMIMLAFCAAASGGALLFGRESPPFCLEIPPLRLPRPGAILTKTAARLKWYLREVLPLFIGISVLIWVLRYSGLWPRLIAALQPPLAAIGLPPETALIFFYGFLRRDYGAAGLFDLVRTGLLDGGQVLTAAVVLTLFVPCVAQVAMLGREYGGRFVLLVLLCTAFLSWTAGLLIYYLTGIPLIMNLLG